MNQELREQRAELYFAQRIEEIERSQGRSGGPAHTRARELREQLREQLPEQLREIKGLEFFGDVIELQEKYFLHRQRMKNLWEDCKRRAHKAASARDIPALQSALRQGAGVLHDQNRNLLTIHWDELITG